MGVGASGPALAALVGRLDKSALAFELENLTMNKTLPPPTLEHLCDLAVTIAAPIEVGQTPAGLRRMIPITGGTVTGPRMNGQVLSGGADFQLILSDGTQAHLDARYVIELDDGSRVCGCKTPHCAWRRKKTLRASCVAKKSTPMRFISAANPNLKPLPPIGLGCMTANSLARGCGRPMAFI